MRGDIFLLWRKCLRRLTLCVCVCVVLGAWTQGLHLKPLHQPFFCEGFFFEIESHELFASPGFKQLLLISASWVARITGVRHLHPRRRSTFIWIIPLPPASTHPAFKPRTSKTSYTEKSLFLYEDRDRNPLLECFQPERTLSQQLLKIPHSDTQPSTHPQHGQKQQLTTTSKHLACLEGKSRK
jgi:hypothetical protein